MRKALEPLILSWRIPELRNRLLFVLVAMWAYVLALYIPVPNVDAEQLKKLFEQGGSILGFLDTFGGGALSRLSILALGIMPYITSSIVFQILTIAFPYFKELQKEGEYGRRKMAQWTRWSAIGLTLLQAIIATRAFMAFGVFGANHNTTMQFIEVVLSLTAGSMFLIWLGEQITAKGVGNGISFIIFAGIVARLPQQLWQTAQTSGPIQVIALITLFVGTVWAIVKVTQGERRIPVKYAPRQAGRRMVQAQRSFLPLKLAAAGVIPIIFAISIVLFPGQIAQFYLTNLQSHKITDGIGYNIAQTIMNWFAPTSLVASLVYAALVMGFTYFYTAVIFDVRDLSDNLKKYGGQIQGYAPGRATELYINKVLTRITFVGGVFLAAVALLQWWAPRMLGLPQGGGGLTLVGGTSLLIVVGVALEIMQNLDQQLKMRQYEGFAKTMQRGRL